MEKKVLLVFVCLFQRNIFLVLLIEIKLEEEFKAPFLNNIKIKANGNYLVVYKIWTSCPYKENRKKPLVIFLIIPSENHINVRNTV